MDLAFLSADVLIEERRERLSDGRGAVRMFIYLLA